MEDANVPTRAMDIAAETEQLIQSLRQDNTRKQLEVRAKKDALLEKLRAKTVPNGSVKMTTSSPRKLSGVKSVAMHLPVARAVTHPLLNGKKRMLGEMKKTALVQGANSMAKLFGYKNYSEQKDHLEKEEKLRVQLLEIRKKEVETKPVVQRFDSDDEDYVPGNSEKSDEEQEQEETIENHQPSTGDDPMSYNASNEANSSTIDTAPDADESVSTGVALDDTKVDLMTAAGLSPDDEDVYERNDEENNTSDEVASGDDTTGKSIRRRRIRRITALSSDEEDNDADTSEVEDNADDIAAKEKRQKDKAAKFRAILAADAKQSKRTGINQNLVEHEAEEEEEEDVLKIGGLGDFGFGVAQPIVAEKDDDLVLREDDLENIVDDLSDDEKDKDADDYFRERMEAEDKEQVSEVMRNVREGFGRNRRIFSASLNGEARGRFNLDELVAADGSRKEAARLGLLESDEEGEHETNENAEEEDEEERMERELRERYQRQPKIYITSSESESEDEEINHENEQDEIPSDEEREARQMKMFSAKAKINRRMQRMVQVQANEPKAALNALDEIDDKDLEQVVLQQAATASNIAPPTQPALHKRKSALSFTSNSSFSRISESCKSASKAFVFTTTETTSESLDDTVSTSTKRKAPSTNSSTVPRKKPILTKKPSALFAALSEYQCT